MNLKEKYESYFTEARPCQDSLKGQFGLFAVGKMIAGTACASFISSSSFECTNDYDSECTILSKNTIPMLVFVVNEPEPLNITFRSNMPITFFISEFTSNRFY